MIDLKLELWLINNWSNAVLIYWLIYYITCQDTDENVEKVLTVRFIDWWIDKKFDLWLINILIYYYIDWLIGCFDCPDTDENLEEVETARFIGEETLGIISQCLDGTQIPELSSKVGWGVSLQLVSFDINSINFSLNVNIFIQTWQKKSSKIFSGAVGLSVNASPYKYSSPSYCLPC